MSTASNAARVSATRRLLVGLAVGALAVAAALTLSTGRPGLAAAGDQGSGGSGGVSTAPSPDEVSGVAYATSGAGTCLTWSDIGSANPTVRDLSQVPCTEPHLFEVAGTADLSQYPGGEFGPQAAFPGVLRFTQLRDEVCQPLVQSYLGGRFDPAGRFSVGLVNPGEQAWAAGQRTLRCGLQQAGRTGALAPVVGRVAELDQSDVSAVGTCSGIDAGLPTDAVDCAAPHASETIAVIDLTNQFPGSPPADTDQDAYLEGVCSKAAGDYTGAPGGAAAKKLTVFWDNVRTESWLAGSRRVNCYVGQALPGGGFAPVTGSARAGAPTPGQAPGTTTAPAPTTTPDAPAASSPSAAPTTTSSAPASASPSP